MLLLYEFDIFWAILIISSVIPILEFFFFIFGVLARKGLEIFFSYESRNRIGRGCLIAISNRLLYVCSSF